MQWSEFQKTAERLSRGDSEGDWQSAISRSYYAIFHYFREFFLARGLDVGRGGQSHFNLYSGLLNCGFLPIAAIASRIDGLRAHRVWADYDLGKTMTQRVALTVVQEAQAVTRDFHALLATVPAAQIVQGARRHLQTIGRLGPMP